ncbi:hypothetical protein G7Z99_02650 [Pseudomonas entomophila]|uniref:hypothetical protein n=1 Tax=Pseudomonas entomophila TaxID=312306 RepID=UPI0015E3276C|nr:hypothetical protein [Pseudomonas entomophila]MBA1187938.1 hypothetical protein [Pseudomonas entomophila]
MDAESMLKAIGIMVALSGWFKVYLDHLANRPKLYGKILCVMKGTTEIKQKEYTSFMLYPYITNLRKNEAYILDYELSYKASRFSKWKRLDRGYGLDKVNNFRMFTSQGEPIVLNRFGEKLIYKNGAIVKHGTALHGWIPFFGVQDLYELDEYKFKLVCIDAFGRRHSIIRGKESEFNLYLVMEIADMSLPSHMGP